MELSTFLQTLEQSPRDIEFDDTMAVIEQNYDFTPTAFSNGDVHNEAGQNSGSCKVFAFAKLHNLPEHAALALFGSYYRIDVMQDPEGDSHQNIRNFILSGFDGLVFKGNALTEKTSVTD